MGRYPIPCDADWSAIGHRIGELSSFTHPSPLASSLRGDAKLNRRVPGEKLELAIAKCNHEIVGEFLRSLPLLSPRRVLKYRTRFGKVSRALESLQVHRQFR